MNEILADRELLVNSDNDGILKELLSYTSSFNVLWGSEYVIMNEESFIGNNADEIVDIMVKSRSVAQSLTRS